MQGRHWGWIDGPGGCLLLAALCVSPASLRPRGLMEHCSHLQHSMYGCHHLKWMEVEACTRLVGDVEAGAHEGAGLQGGSDIGEGDEGHSNGSDPSSDGSDLELSDSESDGSDAGEG